MDLLNIYYQNVRGLRSKCQEVRLNIINNNFDVLVFTESWLRQGVFDGEIIDARYNVYRRDREGKNGGGVIIAVKNSLVSCRLSKWESSCEDLWVTIETLNLGKTRHLAICAVYLPPPVKSEVLGSFLVNTGAVISQNQNYNFMLVGDFNLPNIKWSEVPGLKNLQPYSSSTLDSSFIDFCNENALQQFNHVLNTNQRLLDLILSNNLDLSISVSHNPISVVDPHHPPLNIMVSVKKIEIVEEKINERFNFYKADYVNIIQDLNKVSWLKVLLPHDDVNAMLSAFYKKLDEIIKIHVPKSKSKNKKYPIWFNKPLISLLKRKNKYRLKFKIYKNPLDRLEFEYLRDRCDKLIKICYKNYIEIIEHNIAKNPKYFWTHLKNIKNSTNSYPSKMTLNGKLASDGASICNLFAEHFSSVYSKNSLPGNDFLQTVSSNSLCSVHFTRYEVYKKLKRLDLRKGPGPDNIPAILLVKCASSLSHPISIIYNKSLRSGTFPDFWKRSRIVPIYKKGALDNITNYRPISIISILAKTFESLVQPLLSRHVYQVICGAQHGFVRSKSTATNLSNFTTYLTSKVDARIQVDTVYADLSKAFDKVNHQLLLNKLSSFGFGGPLLLWLSSYLNNRPSCVVVKGYTSDVYIASSGVPQGSILGPLLFNIFINDVTSIIQNSKCFIFADDIKIAKPIMCINDAKALQDDIDRLSAWCKQNGMLLNAEKCSIVNFTRNHNTFTVPYHINGIYLNAVQSQRDLGVTFDNKLTFKEHIDNICKSARKMLGFIFRNAKDFKKLSTIKLLYTSLVRSRLEYCSVVWNPHYQNHKDRIESIQRRFTQFFSHGQYKRAPYKDRLNIFNLSTLSDRRKIIDITFLYKVLNNFVDDMELLNYIKFNVPSRIPRHPLPLLTHTIYRTNLGHHSIFPRLCRLLKEFLAKDFTIDLFHDGLNAFKRKIYRVLHPIPNPTRQVL